MEKLTIPEVGMLKIPEECLKTLKLYGLGELEGLGCRWKLEGIMKGPFEFDVDNERQHGNEIITLSDEIPCKLGLPQNCQSGLVFKTVEMTNTINISWNYAVDGLAISFSVILEEFFGTEIASKYYHRICEYVDGYFALTPLETAVILSSGEALRKRGVKPDVSFKPRPSLLQPPKAQKTSKSAERAPSNKIFSKLVWYWSGIRGVYYNGEKNEKADTKVFFMRKNLSIPTSEKTIFAVYDNTVFGGADDGCVLTDQGVYIRNLGENRTTIIKWEEINNVLYDPLIPNDISFSIKNKVSKKLTCTIMGDDNSKKRFCAMVRFLRNTLINQNSDDKNKD